MSKESPSALEGRESVESIRSAALLYRGHVYTAVTHANALMKLEEQHPDWVSDQSETFSEGFLTSAGRFVSRGEAAEIAEQAGQIKRLPARGGAQPPRELDSHDIQGADLGA